MKGTCVRALLISQCLTGQLILEEKIFSKLCQKKIEEIGSNKTLFWSLFH